MLTWTCHICGKERLDNKISVYSFPWKDDKGNMIEGGTINVRYCNDNPECLAGAKEKEKKGKF